MSSNTSTKQHCQMQTSSYILHKSMSLFQASLPPKFWLEAFSTAVFLINHLPMKQLKFESLFTKLTGKTPYYKFPKVL